MLMGCTSTKNAVVLSPYPAGMLGETKGDFVELVDGKIIEGPITEIGNKTITINGNSYHVKEIKSFEYKYVRSEEHTSELQSQSNLVCRLLLEKKKKKKKTK